MSAATLEVDRGRMDAATEAFIEAVLKEEVAAIREETRALEKDFEAATQAAVKGRLYRAWQSAVYPKNRLAYEPVGEVFVNGRARSKGAMTYWTQPGRNQRKNGWLAIPTKYAGVLGRSRNLTPREWERAHGTKLHFVPRSEGHALLMARQVVYGANGQGVRVATKRRMRNVRYQNADGTPAQVREVPIFTLVPYQDYANKVSLRPLILRREGMLRQNFERRMEKLGRKEFR